MKEESRNPSIDPELEARIVALVLGEASYIERDQLNRLIEQRPELATLKEQFESVHGLLHDVGTGELIAEDDDWKLPAEKRSAVLAVIGGEVNGQPAKPVVIKSAEEPTPVNQNLFRTFSKIAAVFCVVGFLGLMAISELGFRSARVASSHVDVFSELDVSAANERRFSTEQPASGAEPDYEKDSKSAPSTIRTSQAADVAGPSPYHGETAFRELRTQGKETAKWERERLSFEQIGANLAIGSQNSARGEASSQGLPPLRGGTTLDYSTDPIDSQAAGKGFVVDDSTKDSDGIVALGGGLGGGGSVTADALKRDISAKQKRPDEIAKRYLGDRLESQELEETAPSKPIAAGRDMGRTTAEQETADPPMDEFSDAGMPSSSIPGPSNEPIASREDFRRKGKLAETRSESEGTSKESVVMPSVDDIALDVNHALDRGAQTAGGAIQQLGELEAEPSVVIGFDGLGGAPTDDLDVRFENGDYRESLPRRSQVEVEGEPQPQLVTPMLRSRENQVTEWDMGEDREKAMNEKQPNSGAWATNVNRDWLEKLARPQVKELGRKSESMRSAPAQKPVARAGLNEKSAEDEAFSTFSLHVSDVSFKLAQAALAAGEWPEAAKVRIEEFVNAFDYGDPMPSQDEKVSCRMEQSIHPFLQQRNLLRVSMRTAAAGRASNTPLRLTFLLDNSGSMERIDRQQTVRRAFALLAQQLTPIDQVTLISFARQPRLLADKVSGAQASQLVALIDLLPSEGGTNIEAALQLAFEKAEEQKADGAQNRIILLTDGAVNLGDAKPESLSRMITTMRDAGIAFDAAGISAEGLNDEILEALTRKGDGRYYLLDSLEAADDGFARQIAGALHPSAKNVKVQVEFNPKRVGRYKLLGFEKHLLKQEDFRNDNVDAAEMAAAEAGVAVYQFEAKPDGEGDVGSVSVRFRDLSTGQMIENRWPIPYEADAPRVDQAAPSLRIATSAALLAAKLRGEPLGDAVDLKTLSDLISGLPDRDRDAKRVQQLQQMIGQARQVIGN